MLLYDVAANDWVTDCIEQGEKKHLADLKRFSELQFVGKCGVRDLAGVDCMSLIQRLRWNVV